MYQRLPLFFHHMTTLHNHHLTDSSSRLLSYILIGAAGGLKFCQSETIWLLDDGGWISDYTGISAYVVVCDVPQMSVLA